MKRRDVDSYLSYLLERGYKPFERGAYMKFAGESFNYIAERANDP